MYNFKEIVEELSYRVQGAPNLKDNNHLSELVGILRENKWKEDAIIEFLRNLTEKREKGQTWVTKTGHAGWKPSEERARYGMKSAEIAQAYVAGKISDDELDKQEKDDKSEEEPTTERKNLTDDLTPEQKEQQSLENKTLTENTKLLTKPRTLNKGSGVNRLDESQAKDYDEYLDEVVVDTGNPEKDAEATSKNIQKKIDEQIKEVEKTNGKVTDKQIDDTIAAMEKDPNFSKVKASISKKGGPPDSATTGDYPETYPKTAKNKKLGLAGKPHPHAGKSKADVRFRGIVKQYLKLGGRCPVTGEKVALSDMELDHIVSLSNGGKDEPDNWMLVHYKINQFKGANSDTKVKSKLLEFDSMTDEEWASKDAQEEYARFQKEQNRKFWADRHRNGERATPSQLEKLTNAERDAYIYGHNTVIQEKIDATNDPEEKKKLKRQIMSRNKSRTTTVALPNGDKVPYTYTRGGHIRPDKDIPETWGGEVDSNGNVITDPKKLSKEAREIQTEVKNTLNDKSLSKEEKEQKLKELYKRSKDLHKSKRGSGGQAMNKAEQLQAIEDYDIQTTVGSSNAMTDESIKKHQDKITLDKKVVKENKEKHLTLVKEKKSVIKNMTEIINNPNSTPEEIERAEATKNEAQDSIDKDYESQHRQVKIAIKEQEVEDSIEYRTGTSARQKSERVDKKLAKWEEDNPKPNKKDYPKGDKDPQYKEDKKLHKDKKEKLELELWEKEAQREKDMEWMKGKDGWEIIDNKNVEVAKTKPYSEEAARDEVGEYFENEKTLKAVPNLVKDEDELVQKILDAEEETFSSEELQNIRNSDAGEILDASEEGGIDGMQKKGEALAKKYKKGWDYITDNIESGKPQESPIVIRDKNGELYLMAGNTRLMSNTAYGRKIPLKVINYDGHFQDEKK